MDDPPTAESASRNLILGGRAGLWQPSDGYRAGMDAALLAAAIRAGDGARVLEAGCGAGGALVQAALRNPSAHFTGIERDAAAAALCTRNIAENGLGERAQARLADVGAGFRALGEPRFDAAFANPPFFDDEGAIRGPSPRRRGAWIADAGLGAWIGFLLDAVRDGGAVTVIHRADRLADILAALAPAEGSTRAGSVRIRPVQPFAGAAAKRVLVRAVRGGHAPLLLLAPLVLHPSDGGRHTPQAEAILRGDAALGWD